MHDTVQKFFFRMISYRFAIPTNAKTAIVSRELNDSIYQYQGLHVKSFDNSKLKFTA